MNSQASIQNNKLHFLRRVLQANGVFCSVSGLVFIAAARPLAEFLGLDWPLVLVVTGIVLVPYGLALFQMVTRDALIRQVAMIAIVLDIVWVIDSIVLLLFDWVPFTIGGKWAIAIVALIVADFAATQIYALRRMKTQ